MVLSSTEPSVLVVSLVRMYPLRVPGLPGAPACDTPSFGGNGVSSRFVNHVYHVYGTFNDNSRALESFELELVCSLSKIPIAIIEKYCIMCIMCNMCPLFL